MVAFQADYEDSVSPATFYRDLREIAKNSQHGLLFIPESYKRIFNITHICYILKHLRKLSDLSFYHLDSKD